MVIQSLLFKGAPLTEQVEKKKTKHFSIQINYDLSLVMLSENGDYCLSGYSHLVPYINKSFPDNCKINIAAKIIQL